MDENTLKSMDDAIGIVRQWHANHSVAKALEEIGRAIHKLVETAVVMGVDFAQYRHRIISLDPPVVYDENTTVTGEQILAAARRMRPNPAESEIAAIQEAAHDAACAIREYDLQRREAEKRVKALEHHVRLLCDLCCSANEGAFKNGVTDSTGSVDEGAIKSWDIIHAAKKAVP